MNVSNAEEILDSRDILERIQELQDDDDVTDEELVELLSFAEEAEEVDDWWHGAMFIRDNYFETYARELVQDCYEVPNEWPFYHLDWEAIAEEMQSDYTPYNYDGVTYWSR